MLLKSLSFISFYEIGKFEYLSIFVILIFSESYQGVSSDYTKVSDFLVWRFGMNNLMIFFSVY